MDLMPPWQMLLVAYSFAFVIQNKCPFLRGRFNWFDRLLECIFCCGAYSGAASWFLFALASGQFPSPDLAPNLGSFLVWVFASAASSYALDQMVRWLEKEGT